MKRAKVYVLRPGPVPLQYASKDDNRFAQREGFYGIDHTHYISGVVLGLAVRRRGGSFVTSAACQHGCGADPYLPDEPGS